MSDFSHNLTAPIRSMHDQRAVPAKSKYTALTWEQLVQKASDSRGTGLKNASHHGLEPLVVSDLQNHPRLESSVFQATPPTSRASFKIYEDRSRFFGDSCAANERQGRHAVWQYPRSGTPGVPRRNQPKKDLAFKWDEQDNHQIPRSCHALEHSSTAKNTFLDQSIGDHPIEGISRDSPELLHAIGERPVVSSSIRHPAGYTLRSVPGREPVSTATWRSRIPLPKTAHELAQEAEAKARSKARRKEARAQIKAAELAVRHYTSEPLHLISTVEGPQESVPSHDKVPDKHVPSQAHHFDLALRSKLCTPTQGNITGALGHSDLKQNTPHVATQTSLPHTDKDSAGQPLAGSELDLVKRCDLQAHRRSTREDPDQQIVILSDPDEHKVVPDGPVVPTEIGKNVVDKVIDRKRKASEEPHDVPLSRGARQRRNRAIRKKCATAEAINAFIDTVNKAENDNNDDVLLIGTILQKHADIIQWNLLDEEDRQRLLAVGLRPSKMSLRLTTNRQELPRDQLPIATQEPLPRKGKPTVTFKEKPIEQKDKTNHANSRLDDQHAGVEYVASPISTQPITDLDVKLPGEHAEPRPYRSKKKGAHKLREGEMEQKKLELDAKLASEVSSVLDDYRRRRMERRGLENFLEHSFAETGKAYIKVEGKDGEPEYVVWTDLLEMDVGWKGEE